MISRRYRNRRIGEFLKELDFTEGRGTGLPKITRAMKNNGSPEPIFFTDEARTYFYTQIRIHPKFLDQRSSGGVHDGVHDQPFQMSQNEIKILKLCQDQTISMQQILSYFGYPRVTRNLRTNINHLIMAGLIAYTVPDKPRSKNQRYVITHLGINWIRKFN